MKYNILIKYINSFPSVKDGGSVSLERLSKLCEMLGRVNIGDGYIHIYGGAFAHASGVALESILCEAGYSVCRISDVYGYDVRQSVYINRESLSVNDYTDILTYIRTIVKKNSDIPFLREEVVFAFSLYVSKIMGCKFTILENSTEIGDILSAICPKYNYAIVPKIYDDVTEDELDQKCKVIDKVTRGVVTGNNNYYRYFSDKCQRSGIRLSIHRSFEILSETSRKRTINYGGREYVLKSTSDMLCDAVISAIELVEIMKIQGAKIPPAKMVDGINSMQTCGLTDVMSLSPLVVADASKTKGEIALLLSGLASTLEKNGIGSLAVLSEREELLEKAKECVSNEIQIVGVESNEEGVSGSKKYSSIAKKIIDEGKKCGALLVIGGHEFICDIKNAFVFAMNHQF